MIVVRLLRLYWLLHGHTWWHQNLMSVIGVDVITILSIFLVGCWQIVCVWQDLREAIYNLHVSLQWDVG